jgi:RNase P subunit RPR2
VMFDNNEAYAGLVYRRLLCKSCRQRIYQRCAVGVEGEHPVRCPRCGLAETYRLPGEPLGSARPTMER